MLPATPGVGGGGGGGGGEGGVGHPLIWYVPLNAVWFSRS